ncbi:MAG TPA: hypothetical protein VKA01_06270, partial [Vicinamibacteria bacterium]|nr:hypothetical protein [Vicinamibacteria bacterium]
MTSDLRRGAAAAAAAFLALWGLVRTCATGEPLRPRLVLFVSVDQMRYDYLERFAPLFEGGFKALLDR